MGGPVSFYRRFIEGLNTRGYAVLPEPDWSQCAAVLVIGGTRRLDLLWQARLRGLRIVQRLNGMNWMHRKRRTHWKYYLRSEINNALLAHIRRNYADRIIYQSDFARSWWQTAYRMRPKPHSIVFNGVDLERFTPEGPGQPPLDHVRILLVEAHVSEGYEKGLESAISLTRQLGEQIAQPVELMVVGQVADDLRTYWTQHGGIWVTWQGVVARDKIPEIDRSAHLLFSSDLNAACPNSVIEALACGLPVIGYATGALPELVSGESGRVVPYGSNYWNLEPPDVNVLSTAALEILSDLPAFRRAARQRAEAAFSADTMVEAYLAQLVGDQENGSTS